MRVPSLASDSTTMNQQLEQQHHAVSYGAEEFPLGTLVRIRHGPDGGHEGETGVVTAGPGLRSSYAAAVLPDSIHAFVNVQIFTEEHPKPFDVCDITLEAGRAYYCELMLRAKKIEDALAAAESPPLWVRAPDGPILADPRRNTRASRARRKTKRELLYAAIDLRLAARLIMQPNDGGEARARATAERETANRILSEPFSTHDELPLPQLGWLIMQHQQQKSGSLILQQLLQQQQQHQLLLMHAPFTGDSESSESSEDTADTVRTQQPTPRLAAVSPPPPTAGVATPLAAVASPPPTAGVAPSPPVAELPPRKLLTDNEMRMSARRFLMAMNAARKSGRRDF